MSTIFCIIDGMMDLLFCAEDYPILSSMHLERYIETTPEGYAPESLNCILRLLGVEEIPRKLRGYTEALGAGIEVDSEDLILRGSWYSLDEAGYLLSPAYAPVETSFPEGVEYYRLEDYKSLIVLKGLSKKIDEVETFPPYDSAGKCAQRFRPKGNNLLEQVFDTVMSQKRCMIAWGESVPSKIEPFQERAAIICGTNIVRGIARLLQMDLLDVAGATGDVDTDLAQKVKISLEAAKKYPFVLLHINGADEASHRKDVRQKQAFLHRIDREVLPELLKSEHRVIVTSDHTTDPVNGEHVGDLQPVFIKKETSHG